jgi:molybdopterin-guanine dinucleotide biosynthesis protein A
MNVVILAAGAGSRFVDAGYTSTSKVMLAVNDQPVLAHNAFAFQQAGARVVIVANHEVHTWATAAGFESVRVPVLQPGPAASALLATSVLPLNEPVLFCDGDLFYAPEEVTKVNVQTTAELGLGNGILVSDPSGPHPDRSGFAVSSAGCSEILERGCQEPHTIAGGYGFPSLLAFRNAYYKHCSRNLDSIHSKPMTETKMSDVVNECIRAGIRFSPVEVKSWTSVGTPAEYKALLNYK